MSTTSVGGYLIPVEVRFINDVVGKGVFSLEFVPKDTLIWTPGLVRKYSPHAAEELLSGLDAEGAKVWLRQTFILTAEPDFLCANVTDDGRFTNHSSNPNSGFACAERPSVALRDIHPGDEITCDYSGLASPEWYVRLCEKYGALPTCEVVKKFS